MSAGVKGSRGKATGILLMYTLRFGLLLALLRECLLETKQSPQALPSLRDDPLPVSSELARGKPPSPAESDSEGGAARD